MLEFYIFFLPHLLRTSCVVIVMQTSDVDACCIQVVINIILLCLVNISPNILIYNL